MVNATEAPSIEHTPGQGARALVRASRRALPTHLGNTKLP